MNLKMILTLKLFQKNKSENLSGLILQISIIIIISDHKRHSVPQEPENCMSYRLQSSLLT